MIRLAAIVVTFGGSVWCLLRMAATSPTLVEPPLSWWPCDVCDRPVLVEVAHTHHHEPGCGIDDPEREQCLCDAYRCAGCCPCDIEAGAVAS